MVNSPEWLTLRTGTLRPGIDGQSWFVCFDGGPQYELKSVPALGKFACEILQTVNGKRLDGKGTYATGEDAIRGGLEDLRNALGW